MRGGNVEKIRGQEAGEVKGNNWRGSRYSRGNEGNLWRKGKGNQG